MVRRVSGDIAEAAAQRELGGLARVYESRRGVSALAGGLMVAVAAVLALVATFAAVAVIAVGLVAVVVIGLWAYTRLVPPSGGRHLVSVYDNGFVDSVPGRPPLAVRWDEIVSVEYEDPAGAGIVVEAGAPVRIGIAGLHRQDEFAARVERRVQPRVLARAEAELARTGGVVFGRLSADERGIGRVPGEDRLPWERIATHARVGRDRLVVRERGVMEGWFDEPVPNAIVADRMIDQIDPTGRPAQASSLVEADLLDQEVQAYRRRRRASYGALILAAIALAPALLYPATAGLRGEAEPVAAGPAVTATATATPEPSPTTPPALPIVDGSPDPLGFYEVCTGSSFSGAAAYTGRGPHPVALFVKEDGYWVHKSKGFDGDDALSKYRAASISGVQLVACIERTDGPQLHSCGIYYGKRPGEKSTIVSVYIHWRDFTINLLEARTGRKVAGPIKIRGNKGTTCPSKVSAGEETISRTLWTELTGAQVERALAKYLD